MVTKLFAFVRICMGTILPLLIRGIGVEWARMLYGQMRVTGIGWDALFNGSDALNEVPAQILEALVQQGHEQKHVRHE